MQKILFLRRFKKTPPGQIRTSGTHIKIRDYFLHCLHHPRLDPYLYFTPDSDLEAGDVWQEIPQERIVRTIELATYDLLFLTGRDWRFLPRKLPGKQVINLLQSLEQCESQHPAFRYLKRPAYRICVSPAIRETIMPHANGPAVVINYGIPLELFAPGPQKIPGSIAIWAKKNPAFGTRLAEALGSRGHPNRLMVDFLPRTEFARVLAESDILIALSQFPEGFYLPALEGMASGCAVVCADAVGNRGFCLNRETCMMPKFDDLDDYLRMIELLLEDAELRERIRRGGLKMAATYTMEKERENFYRFLDQHIL